MAILQYCSHASGRGFVSAFQCPSCGYSPDRQQSGERGDPLISSDMVVDPYLYVYQLNFLSVLTLLMIAMVMSLSYICIARLRKCNCM